MRPIALSGRRRHAQVRHLGPLEALLRHQLLRPDDARLALGAARLGAPAQPRHFLRNPALALVLGNLRVLLRHQLLLHVRLVVAGVGRHALAGLDFDDAVHQSVQEVAVVRDEQQRPRQLVQLLLQPVHRVGVQVVGGLVQQEQIGPRQQRPGNGHPLAQATGQLRHRPVPVLHAQPVEQRLGVVLGAPAAHLLNAVAEGGELLHQLLVLLGRGGLQPLAQLGVRGQGLLQRGLRHGQLRGHRGALGELRLLRQVGDTGAAAQLQLARVRLRRAGENLHQRRFAGAVDAHQAHALALFNREGEALEDGAAAEAELDVGGTKQRHGVWTPEKAKGAPH